jgi:hypothetical protein
VQRETTSNHQATSADPEDFHLPYSPLAAKLPVIESFNRGDPAERASNNKAKDLETHDVAEKREVRQARKSTLNMAICP